MAAKIPVEHEEAMIAAYLAGASLAEAAAPFGYSLSTCANAIRRHGLTARSTRVPKEHEEAIIKAYLAGSSAKAAVAPFGYSPDVCLKILRRNNIPARHQKVTFEQEKAIIKAYQDGASAKQAAALFGYSDGTALSILRRNGIPIRSLSEAGLMANRRYAIDETFFDQIDTEAKAYWLGFLTADGCVYTDAHEKIIRLELKASDAGHLYKLADDLHSQHPIVLKETKGYKVRSLAHILINSTRLVNALNQLGVKPRKSFTIRPCEQIPSSLLAPYWRGVFDGDGSIGYINRVVNPYWYVHLCGTQPIVEGFREFISQFVTSRATVRPHGSVFAVNYGGTNLPRTVARILYDGATVYLDRKYELAQKLIADS